MSCGCDSKSANLQVTAPDPGKHVNYLLGMVLGEDDFRQEFAYHANRDMWLARDLIGYGTVRGLAVSTEPAGSNEVKVRVEAGVALSPNGQLICVPEAQCADLNGWLKANNDEVRKLVGAVPGKLDLYLTLCYRACPTDAMPIPGEPCRSDAELTQPSRLSDDFCLGFKLLPPRQREEDAIRDICKWLRQIDMRDNGQPSSSIPTLLAAMKAAASEWLGSPPASPPADFFSGSPPAALHIAPGDVVEHLRAAFQYWSTVLRPLWVERTGACGPGCGSNADCCCDDVLLAILPLNLHDDGGLWLAKVSPKPEPVIQPAPTLLHLRMLQEWLLGALGESAVPDASNALPSNVSFGQSGAAGSSEDYSRADHTHPTQALPQLAGDVTGDITANSIAKLQGNALKAATPADGSVLVCRIEETGDRIWAPELLVIPAPGGPVVSETSFGLSAVDGSSAAYARADHSHGSPTLTGDVQINGSAGDNQVKQLQGKVLNVPTPQDGQVLTFRVGSPPSSGQWVAAAPVGGGPVLQPGSSVSPANSFGLPSAVGSSAAYARADHSHGTPQLPGLGGDVGGNFNSNQIQALQGIDLKADSPQDGQLLGFDKSNGVWRPFDAPQAGGGLAVTRPIQNPYAIVAAGWVEIDIDFGATGAGPFEKQQARVSHAYNKLQARLPYADDLGGLRLQFDGFDPDASYIVKLTPVLDAGQERANGVPMLFCSGFFAPKPRVPGGVGVVIRSPGDDIFQTVRFMVEISQFTPDKLG